MRWIPKEKPEWRPFFAVIPMKVEGTMVWLEWIETKKISVMGDYGSIFRLPRTEEGK